MAEGEFEFQRDGDTIRVDAHDGELVANPDDAPVTLVERHRFASSEFVLDRALTSALAGPLVNARARSAGVAP